MTDDEKRRAAIARWWHDMAMFQFIANKRAQLKGAKDKDWDARDGNKGA